jgi:zinc/manganese transport system ATP-binding protein
MKLLSRQIPATAASSSGPSAAELPGSGERSAPPAMLTVDGVSVRLAGRDVLADVRFSIGRGEFVGLIGSNGAGKTTLLRVILGLQATTSGTVRIGGVERGAARGSLVGYVPQKVVLDPDMPVRAADLVGLGLDGGKLGIPLRSRSRQQRVAQMLAAVDATRYANERVGNLSGGELQRVLIAHALISRPALLLMDEPLAALDIRSEREIVELLSRVATAQRIAVLLSAHDMNPLLPFMDRIVYLAGGRAASGRTSEVVRPEVLSRLYGQHVDVIEVHDRILVVAGRDAEPVPDLPCADDSLGDHEHSDHARSVAEGSAAHAAGRGSSERDSSGRGDR